MTPISWKTIQGPSNDNLIVNGMNSINHNINAGWGDFQKAFQNAQNKASAELKGQYLDMLQNAQTEEDLQRLQASGQLDALRQQMTQADQNVTRGGDIARLQGIRRMAEADQAFQDKQLEREQKPLVEQVNILLAQGKHDEAQAVLDANEINNEASLQNTLNNARAQTTYGQALAMLNSGDKEDYGNFIKEHGSKLTPEQQFNLMKMQGENILNQQNIEAKRIANESANIQLTAAQKKAQEEESDNNYLTNAGLEIARQRAETTADRYRLSNLARQLSIPLHSVTGEIDHNALTPELRDTLNKEAKAAGLPSYEDIYRPRDGARLEFFRNQAESQGNLAQFNRNIDKLRQLIDSSNLPLFGADEQAQKRHEEYMQRMREENQRLNPHAIGQQSIEGRVEKNFKTLESIFPNTSKSDKDTLGHLKSAINKVLINGVKINGVPIVPSDNMIRDALLYAYNYKYTFTDKGRAEDFEQELKRLLSLPEYAEHLKKAHIFHLTHKKY